MKREFHYDTCQNAYEALIKNLNNRGDLEEDFDWDSIEQIDFWLNEFIRDTDEDLNWLNNVINLIGHECSTIKYWFSIQAEDSDSRTDSSFKLICRLDLALND
jgi:hypothetical protein